MPSGFGGDFVPGPPRFCQSSQDPRYSPMFIYLPYESVSVLCLFGFQKKNYCLSQLDFGVHSGMWTYPACLAIPAAAELLTPALQKKTTSFPFGGF